MRLAQSYLHFHTGYSNPITSNELIPAYGACMDDKHKSSMRVAVQNTRGMTLGNTNEGNQSLQLMKEKQIDLLGMSETNKHWSTEACRILATLVNKDSNGKSIASSDPSPKEGYLPGGTAMIIKGPHAGRVCKRYPDKLGRYSYVALHGKDGSGIVIITIYRTPHKKGSRPGPDTSFMRQYNAIRMEGTKNPDPKSRLMSDLTTLISDWGKKGFHPMIMGDYNSEIHENDMVAFVEQNRLHDLVGEDNTGHPPRTSIRGQRRIDFVLGDKHVQNAVVKSGALEENDGFSPTTQCNG